VREVASSGQIALGDRSLWQAERIVLAVPPRIAATLHFEPALDPRQRQLLTEIPTWMAGHAKLVAVYEEPFWRREGLSGDAMSRSGPLMELHDASPQSGQPGAIFGFTGFPPRSGGTTGTSLSRQVWRSWGVCSARRRSARWEPSSGTGRWSRGSRLKPISNPCAPPRLRSPRTT